MLGNSTAEKVSFASFQGSLIKIVLHSGGHPVTAIIDTGSELNIIRSEIANTLQLPIDITKSITMNDANGGVGKLIGLAEGVDFQCGGVKTTADLWIGSNSLPFDLLLGRTWQQDNLVSTDERLDGTYVVFRDPTSGKGRYEIFVGEGSRNKQPIISKYFQVKPSYSSRSYAILASEIQGKSPVEPHISSPILEEFRKPASQDELNFRPGGSNNLAPKPLDTHISTKGLMGDQPKKVNHQFISLLNTVKRLT